MPSLAALSLKQAYHKPEDDIAREFYLPCLASAKRYDRAVGFFSSSIYALAWPSLKQFVSGGGKMRLICSPVLSSSDSEAMSEGYSARAAEDAAAQIRADFRRLLETPGMVKPARVLAALVALDVIDFRIAWVGTTAGGQPKRLFHDKLGIFRDELDAAVAFKGSMNETWPGLALDGNLESVDVYLSWEGEREGQRVQVEQEYFDRLWTGQFPGVTTVPLPQVTKDDLVAAARTDQWDALVDEICVEIDEATAASPDQRPGGRVPRPHQIAALDAWRARGRRGILEHATGSGKTFTALCAIKEALEKAEVPLVIVPSDLLLKQWTQELRAAFDHLGLSLLVCGGGHTHWRDQGRLRLWTRPPFGGEKPRCVLATLQTASSAQFVALCKGGDHLFFVADEVHRLGAAQARTVFNIGSGPRLGLSATPRRAGDLEGTTALLAYFDGIVEPPFTLYDAIAAGTLTPYAYHVHRITLDADEQERWDKLSNEVRRLYAQLKASSESHSGAHERLKQLLIQRARIVKSARQKVAASAKIVAGSYRPGQHWIVYCDDQVQLTQVREALRAAGCDSVLEYHSGMAGDPTRTLDLFSSHGGIVVSIRCLDEGVDIPAVSHALILASSKNPREYVQRRGRVLRRQAGKYVAHVHDVLVTPRFDGDEPPAVAILEGELARAIEFGERALNPGCITDLQKLAIEHGLDWKTLSAAGVEDDEEDDEAAAS
jgi:superfamily II DNA or RNA helicase